MKRPKRLWGALMAAYFVIVCFNSVYFYRKDVASRLDRLDATLYTAAVSLDFILGEGFHSRYTRSNPLPPSEYRELVEDLNVMVEDLGIEYVYSMARVDGKIYFVTSNETEADRKRGTLSVFYNPYPEPPEDLSRAFDTGKVVYSSSYTNLWDSFRSVFIPRRTETGLSYILAADIKLAALNTLFRNRVLSSLLYGLLFLLPVVPVFLLYRRMVTQREKALHQRLYYDSLTGLPNRNSALEDFKKERLTGTAAIMNIDGFKEINDLFGHEAGDALIKDIADLLSREFPQIQHLYRLPGDEFLMVLEETGTEALGREFLELIDRVSSTSFKRRDRDITVTVTIGVCPIRPGLHPLAGANGALFRARQNGDSLAFYDAQKDLRDRYKRNLYWLNELKEAIHDNRLVAYYQPISCIATGEISKHEALIRLVDREGQVVSPAEFLPVAKKSKLYKTITHTIIRQAFEAFSQTGMSVSINLTTRDLLEKKTVEYLLGEMERQGMEGRVIIELVESESVTQYEQIIQQIQELKKRGILVAIDDFGSGYSNFNYLLQLQADFLKIDGSLLQNITRDNQSRIIVQSIVSFAQKLGIQLVAEYVTSEASLEIIREMGVEFAQGYFISKPVPQEEIRHS